MEGVQIRRPPYGMDVVVPAALSFTLAYTYEWLARGVA
jgi:hypothetical protein